MTASEFAFLALGLVLGVAAGAALVEVARSRPAAPREIRVTVAPNSIRTRATTLADGRQDATDDGPARGGPADRRWVDRPEDEPADGSDDPPVAGSGADPGPNAKPADDPPPPPASAEPLAASRTPVPFVLQPATRSRSGSWLDSGSGRPPIGIAIASEADPMMAALREPLTADATARREADARLAAEAPMAMAAAAARGGATGAATETAVATAPDLDPGDAPRASADEPAGSPGGGAGAIDSGPCADQRRVADERCAVAARAREGATRAAEVHRKAQREYDDNAGRAEKAGSKADARSVRTAKEAAQQAFRTARAAATSRDAIEAAARDWLTEINRINLATREAVAKAEQHRAVAAGLAPTLERLALEADAARISAESAEEACVAAREAVATCEEAAAAAAAAAVIRHAQPLAAGRAGPTDLGGDDRTDEGAEPDTFEDEDSMGSRAGEDAAIIRLLRGDREILPRIVAHLAGTDPEEERRWRTLLSGLVEALVARSIEAASFDFPAQHPFWGPFTRAQNRDIAAALASLGYRHDGFGGWADERVPSQRDLSLAVGYAGLDPMRIRHWPTETEMVELMGDVTVAADEYVWEAAGALTLGELVSLLGRRADGLTDLWNDWGAVRPLLLAAG